MLRHAACRQPFVTVKVFTFYWVLWLTGQAKLLDAVMRDITAARSSLDDLAGVEKYLTSSTALKTVLDELVVRWTKLNDFVKNDDAEPAEVLHNQLHCLGA